MINWHIAKCRYTKELPDGTLKRVTEAYLVSSQSITDAEARIYQEVGEYVRGEFVVTGIQSVSFADIFQYDDSDIWFESKVTYTSEDADSGKEKRYTNKFLVTASNVKEAYERIEESLKGLIVSYTIPEIKESKIIDVFTFEHEEEPVKESTRSFSASEDD